MTLIKKTTDTLKPAKTPFLDESKVENSSENKECLLAPIARKVLMTILYGARLARFDLLRSIAILASKITKWDIVCDRMLHGSCAISTHPVTTNSRDTLVIVAKILT